MHDEGDASGLGERRSTALLMSGISSLLKSLETACRDSAESHQKETRGCQLAWVSSGAFIQRVERSWLSVSFVDESGFNMSLGRERNIQELGGHQMLAPTRGQMQQVQL